MPSVSFIVPAYNEEALIARCLLSIATEIARNPDVTAEIIVVDNDSTDGTRDVVRGLSAVRLISEPRRGVVFARQAGLDAARYEYLANIDADNEVPAGWLARALRALDDPSVVAVSGRPVFPELPFWARWGAEAFYGASWLAHHSLGPVFYGSNYLVRRSALEAVGGYDTSVEFFGEDTRTAQRLARVGRVKYDLRLHVNTSARRFLEDGILRTSVLYTVNYFWITLFRRPWSVGHRDVRVIDG